MLLKILEQVPAIAGVLLLLSACSFSPPQAPYAGGDPADARAPVRPVTDTGVIGAYQNQRPVAPRDWREQNERVAPQRRP